MTAGNTEPTISKHFAFICHSSINSETAYKIAHRLEAENINCWIAPRDVPAGTNYAAAIVQGIKRSTVLVFVFTTASNASDAVTNEIEKASSMRMPIISFKIDNIEYADALEYYLRNKQAIMAFNKSMDKAIDELIMYIKKPDLPKDDTNTGNGTKKGEAKNNSLKYIIGSVIAVLIIVFIVIKNNSDNNNALRKAMVDTAVAMQADNTKPDAQTNNTPPADKLDIDNGKVLLDDNFSSNINNWDIGRTGVLVHTFENGIYSLQNLENRSFSTSDKKISINAKADFLIEITARTTDDPNWFYGVGWSSDYVNNVMSGYIFDITPGAKMYEFYGNGGYITNGMKYGNGKEIIGRKTSDKILNSNQWNTITIIRKGAEIQFYLNNYLIDKAPYFGFDITTIGIGIAGGPVKVEFKEFKVESN